MSTKGHRNGVNKRVMDEMSEVFKDQTHFQMSADMTKMTYGELKVVVEG